MYMVFIQHYSIFGSTIFGIISNQQFFIIERLHFFDESMGMRKKDVFRWNCNIYHKNIALKIILIIQVVISCSLTPRNTAY